MSDISTRETPAPTGPGGFVMVPAWLAWKKPDPNEIVVYIHLALHGTWNPAAGTYDECRPSKRTLAKGDPRRGYPGTGLSEATIVRALRGLERHGAIKGTPSFDPVTGAQGATIYRVIFGRVVEPEPAMGSAGGEGNRGGIADDTPSKSEPHVTGDTPPGVSEDTPGGVTDLIHNLEPLTQRKTSLLPPRTKRQRKTAPPDTDAVVEEGSTPDDNPNGVAGSVLDAVLDRALADKRRAPGGKYRDTLVGAVVAAGAAGWDPFDLVAALGDPLDGVKSVFGVLRHRLRELGPPPARSAGPGGAGRKSAWPVWCGECHEGTRQVLDAEDRPGRCPVCHPLVVATPARNIDA